MTNANTLCVSIDIETLGPEPDGAIVSIGAVAFDAFGIRDTAYFDIDPETALDLGMSADDDTMQWWRERDADVRDALDTGADVTDELQRFIDWYPDDADEVWAYPPHFDIQILETAFDLIDADAPWGRWDKKDVGSLIELSKAPDVERTGTEHNALDDARYQAKSVVAVMYELD